MSLSTILKNGGRIKEIFNGTGINRYPIGAGVNLCPQFENLLTVQHCQSRLNTRVHIPSLFSQILFASPVVP